MSLHVFYSTQHLSFSWSPGKFLYRHAETFERSFQFPGDGVGNEYAARFQKGADMAYDFVRPHFWLVLYRKSIKINQVKLRLSLEIL